MKHSTTFAIHQDGYTTILPVLQAYDDDYFHDGHCSFFYILFVYYNLEERVGLLGIILCREIVLYKQCWLELYRCKLD